jgi:dynein heavy chain, axonemal
LNKKRAEFPRFYFLSADSLIEVLSEARDPTKIQKFAKILFEGVKTFNFDKDERILGVTSTEGEKIEFTEAIETAHHQGLVEKWLRIFEDTMAIEVRRFIEISFEEHDLMEREKFILDRPGMAVLNVNMTKWTSDTEEAIKKGGTKGLSNLLSQLNGNLENIVELVKKPLSVLNRCTLEALIVLDVHNRVVVNDLIQAKVQSITDFDYEAQLRYYWE